MAWRGQPFASTRYAGPCGSELCTAQPFDHPPCVRRALFRRPIRKFIGPVRPGFDLQYCGVVFENDESMPHASRHLSHLRAATALPGVREASATGDAQHVPAPLQQDEQLPLLGMMMGPNVAAGLQHDHEPLHLVLRAAVQQEMRPPAQCRFGLARQIGDLAPSNDAYLLQLGHQFLRNPARTSFSHMLTPPESCEHSCFPRAFEWSRSGLPSFLTSEFVLVFCPCSCPAASG